ncbi:MAG: hypothetical protein IIV41_10090 [Akkermansia sp.]|nr:hypothetical protein [Akkermansia sp.]
MPAEDNPANGRSIGAEDTIAQNAEDINSENQTTATFSIRAANPSTLDRFTAAPLGERIIHTIRTECARNAPTLILEQGPKPPAKVRCANPDRAKRVILQNLTRQAEKKPVPCIKQGERAVYSEERSGSTA